MNPPCAAIAFISPAMEQQQKIPASTDILAFYQKYEASVTGARVGCFAIAIAIANSYVTSIQCPDTRCRDSGGLKCKVALRYAEKGGVDCITFSRNCDIKVECDLIDE